MNRILRLGLIALAAVTGSFTLAQGAAPASDAPAPTPYFFVTGSVAGTVAVVDQCQTLQTLYGFSRPEGVAVSADGSRAFVANREGDSVTVLDAHSWNVISVLGTGASSFPKSVAVNPNGSYPELYVATANGVNIYDTESYALQATFPNKANMVAVSPDGAYLAMTTSTGAALASVPSRVVVKSTTGLSAPIGVAFNAQGTRYYVAETTAARLAVFNGTSGVQLGTIALSGNPFTVACAPRANILYAVQRGSSTVGGTLHVINGATGGVMTTLPLGLNAAGVSFHPTLDIALVANQSEYSVTEIDSATHTVIQSCGADAAAYAFGQAVQPAANPGPPTLANGSTLPGAAVTCAYSLPLGLSGGIVPFTWAITAGALPAGLALNAGTGVISGTPTGAGTANFTVTVTDAEWVSGSKAFSLTVQPALGVASISPLPAAIRWGAYGYALAASGGTPPYAWALTSGALPSGLRLSGAGAISGIPDALQTATFAVQVTDACGKTASAGFTLTVQGGLDITHLAPMAVSAGSGAFLLTVQGTGFGSGSVLRWNGVDQGTTWVSASEVRATIPAAYLMVAGFADVSVYAPSPVAGVTPVRSFWIAPAGSPGPVLYSGNGVGSVNRLDTWQSASLTPFTGYTTAYNTAVEPGGGRLWVCGSSDLKRLDPASGAVLASASGLNLSQLPVPSPARDRLYHKASNSLVVFRDPSTLVGGPFVSTSTGSPETRVSPDGTRLYVAQGAGGTRVVRTADAQVLKDLAYATNGLAVSGDGTRLYLSDQAGGIVRVVDANTFQLLDTLTGLSGPGPLALALDDTRLCVLDTAGFATGLKAVDLSTRAIQDASGGPCGGTSLTVHPNGAWVYVSQANNGRIQLWDARTARPRFEETYALSYPQAGAYSMEPAPRALALASSATLPNAWLGSSYRHQVLAWGGRPYYAWTVTAGALPAGLIMDSRGEITGVPTAAGLSSFTAQATDSLGAVVSRTFSLTVDPAPYTVTLSPSSPLPDVTVSQCGVTLWPYTVTLAGVGGTGPYTFRILSGSLPAGLSLDGVTGGISGHCCSLGTTSFSLYCEDANGVGSGSLPYQLTVVPAPAVTTPVTLPTATVGYPYSTSFAGTGAAPLAWAFYNSPPPNPAYPPGLTLSTSGLLSGVPTTAGSYYFSVKMEDRNGAWTTWVGVLPVVAPQPVPALAALSPAAYIAGGDAFTLTLTGANFTPQSQVLWNGVLKSGVYVSPTSLTLAVPSADVASIGVVTVTVRNTGPGGGTSSQSLGVVAEGPRGYLAYRLKGVAVFDPSRGVVYKRMPLTGNYPELVVGNRTDAILYLLRAGTLEAYDAQALSPLNAVMLAGANSTVAYDLVLSPAEDYLYAAVGDRVFKINASTLVATTLFVDTGISHILRGLALSPDGKRLFISTSSNSHPVVDTATGAVLADLWPQLVAGSSVFRALFSPDGRDLVLSSYYDTYIFDAATLKLSRTLGFGVYGYVASGPIGALVFNAAGTHLYFSSEQPLYVAGYPMPGVGAMDYATGRLLWFTPTPTGGGARYLAVDTGDQNLYASTVDDSATDALVFDASTGTFKGIMALPGGQLGPRAMAIAPGAVPALTLQTMTPLPAATQGSGYPLQLVASGGKPPYSWSVTAGSLPPGISLDPAKGTLSGSPAAAGPHAFTIRVDDAAAATTSKSFSLTVGPTLGITTPILPGGLVGVEYPPLTLVAAGGASPYTWSIVSGALPAGLSLNPTSGTVTGAPTAAQSASFRVQVSGGGTATRDFTVAVLNPVPRIGPFQPPSSYAGASGLSLGVTGSRFVPTSQVSWQGAARATTYTSATALSAQILGTDIASPGSYTVTVDNPAPGGGALSAGYTLCTAVAGPQSSLRITRSGSSVSLSWALEAGITSYKVKRCGTTGGFCQPTTVVATVSGTTYTDNVGTSSLSYFYAVEAVGPCGNVP